MTDFQIEVVELLKQGLRPGEVSKKLNFKVHRISEKTKELVEKAGGKVEILEIKSYSTVAGNNKKEEK